MANKPPRQDYEVGYGKPPSHAQFKKGQSGNPRGRPRKSSDESLRDSVKRIVSKKQRVTINGALVHMSPFELTLTQLALKASAGSVSAARELRHWLVMFDLQSEEPAQDPFDFLSFGRPLLFEELDADSGMEGESETVDCDPDEDGEPD